ncbi:MAG: glycosyltransferase [Rhodocyclaceae bacterium]|nr:glycosyltransferase [Rhodocyclaceae bacterium]
MKILFLSHTATGGDFVVGSHHLSRAMVRMGHRVAHLSPPVTPAHLLRLGAPFERQRIARWFAGGACVHGVIDLVPFSPLPWALCRRLSRRPHKLFGALTNASAMRGLAGQSFATPDLVCIDEPRLAAIADAFPRARLVYRPTDLYAQIRDDRSVLAAERELVDRAHAFVATSEPVADHLRNLGAEDVLVIENGVDVENFLDAPIASAPPELADLAPIAIYAGAFDQRFGVDLLHAVAQNLPDVTFAMIGPADTHIRARFAALANVRFLGPVRFEDLPRYLRHASVGLLPLSSHPSNAGRSPMKLYEYAASGLPVVASWTPELARRALPFVQLADAAQNFADCLRRALVGDGRAADGVDIARGQSWAVKSQQLLDFVCGMGAVAR